MRDEELRRRIGAVAGERAVGPPGSTTTPGAEAAPARYPAAPPMPGDSGNHVLAGQLVTPASGWALTRTGLAWTGDGARTWRTITPRKVPAGRVRGAFFLDPRTGWMVASAKVRETGPRVQLAVYRTGDAGATWRWSSLGELDLGGDDAIGGYEGGLGVLAPPSFVDQRNGWVSVLTSSTYYKGHRFLFLTTDGGATWTRLPQPPATQRAVHSSRSRGWAVVMGSAAATSGQGRGAPGLYTTADAGRDWRREPPTFKNLLDGFLPVEFIGPERGRPRVLAVGFYSPPTAARPGRPGTCRWPRRTRSTSCSRWPPPTPHRLGGHRPGCQPRERLLSHDPPLQRRRRPAGHHQRRHHLVGGHPTR